MKKNKPKINKNKYIPKYNLGGYSTPEGTFNADGTQITGPYGSTINNTDAYNTAAPMIMDAGYATNDAIKLNDTSNKAYRKEDNADIGGQVAAAGTGAVGGAAAGAKIGAAIGGTAGTAVGPAGTVAGGGAGALIGGAIGGVVGGASGFFKKRSQDKKQWKAEQEQENQQMLATQNKPMYVPQVPQQQLMPQQYSQQPGFYAKNGGMMGMKMYPYGGEMYNPNAEAENDELVTTNIPPQVISGGEVNMVSNNPYGTPDYAINGNNHGEGENGGGVKMNVANGSVFKGKRKNPMTGNLFKDDFKKISRSENKLTKKLELSGASKTSANILLPMLAKKKEAMEEYQQALLDNDKERADLKKGIMPSQHKMSDGSIMNDSEMYRNGGLKRSEDFGSEDKPYPSVKSNDFAGGNRSYPIPTKEDAIDALRLAGLHGRNDIRNKVYSKYPSLKKYIHGGTHIGDTKYGSYVNGNWEPFPTYAQSTPKGTFNAEGEMTALPYGRTYIKPIESKNINPFIEAPEKFNPVDKNELSPGYNYKSFTETAEEPKDYSNLTSNLAGLASLAGPVTGLLTNKSQTPVSYQSASYIPMDPSAELRANANAAAIGRNMLKQNAQGAGSYLSNISAQNAANREANAATLTKYSNINTQGYNRAAEARADAANKSMDATAADQARTRDLKTKYVGDIGTGVAKLAKDEKATQQDYKTLGMISSLYPDYKYNQKTGEWRHKNSNVKLSQEEINKIYK